MISYKNAQALIFARAKQILKQVRIIDLDLSSAINSYLAARVKADKDYPAYNRAAVDGYALSVWPTHYADQNCLFDIYPHPFLIGQLNDKIKLPKLSAAKVLTGAMLSKSVLAVVKTEDVLILGSKIKVPPHKLALGANISFKADFLKKNQTISQAGELVNPAIVSSAAGFGYARLKVYQKPKVAFFATGDEVFKHTANISAYQTRDVSTPFLVSFLSQQSVPVHSFGIFKDDFDVLLKNINSALIDYNVIITAGGAAGSFKDLTVKVFEKLGASKIFYQVAIKPGKQVWFGKLDAATIFVLPGNPLAFQMAFMVYVWPFLQIISGKKNYILDYTTLRINHSFKNNTALSLLVPFKLIDISKGLLEVARYNSADFSIASRTDGFFYVAANQKILKRYSQVPALFW